MIANKIEIKLLMILIPLILLNPAQGLKDPCIIYGYVKNQDGRVIGNAFVTVFDNQTGQKRTTTTDNYGKFSVILDDYAYGDEIHIIATDGKNSGEIIFSLVNQVSNRVDVVINQPSMSLEPVFLASLAILIAGGSIYLLIRKRGGEK